MVGELLHHADQDVELAQRGIVFIDEVDKIARRSHGARTGAGSRDIGGEGVQQSLLKMLEGREIFAPLNVTQHWNKHDFVVVDTQDILFIAAGTFSDLRLYEASQAGRLRRRRRRPTAPRRGGSPRRSCSTTACWPSSWGGCRCGSSWIRSSEDDLYRILTGPARRRGARVPGAAEDGRRRAALRGGGPARDGAHCIRRHTGRPQPAHLHRGDLPRGDVRGARAQGRDDRRSTRRPSSQATSSAWRRAPPRRELDEDLASCSRPAAQAVLVRVLPARRPTPGSRRWSAPSASWPTCSRRSCR